MAIAMEVARVKEVRYEKRLLVIKFGGPHFTSGLRIVKTLDGRSFDSQTKTWEAPATKRNVSILKENDFDFMGSAIKIKEKKAIVKKDVKIDESQLKGLRTYQKRCVEWLEERGGVGLIGDDMGLGKTIESIAYLKLHKELRPALIVCQQTMKLKWAREIKKWTGEDAVVLYHLKPSTPPPAPFYVINYDILGRLAKGKRKSSKNPPRMVTRCWVNALSKLKPKALIGDEVQMISNQNTARAQGFIRLRKFASVKAFIPASGTPIKKGPKQFFTVLNLLDNATFSNRYKYYFRYCDPIHNGFGWEFNGATNTRELHELIRPLMIRRLKKDVLAELPKKQRICIPLELDPLEEKRYKQADKEFMKWVREHIRNKKENKNKMEKLKQLAYIAKRNSVFQWIDEYLEGGKKLVVYTFHKKVMDDMMWRFGKIAVKCDGRTSAEEKQAAEDRFQTDGSCRMFVGQMIAASNGLTLTAAPAVAIVEFAWLAMDHEQAEDRINRLTQEADSITAYYLIANGTIEEDIMELIETSNVNVYSVLDGKTPKKFFNGDILTGMMKKMAKKVGVVF